jgi:cell division protein FtsW
MARHCAEVVVLAAILFLAQALDLNRTARRPFEKSVAGLIPLRLKKLAHALREPLFAVGMTAFLLFAQLRVGAALVLMLTQFVVMVAGRVRWWLVTSVYVAALGPGLFLAFQANPNRLRRLLETFLNPRELCGGIPSLVSGGSDWSGRGLGQSAMRRDYPVIASTDCVALVVREELGILGLWLPALLFGGLLAGGVIVSARARDDYGRLLGAGICAMIAFPAYLHLTMAAWRTPNMGQSLPFISDGGISICAMLAAVGVLISIERHRGRPMAQTSWK